MTFRQSTIRLSVEDNFSAPLEAYAAGMMQADVATASAAAGAEASSAATTQLTDSLAVAGEAQIAFAGEMADTTVVEETNISVTEAMSAANQAATTAMMALAGAGIAVGLATGVAKAAFDNTVGSAEALGAEVRKLQFETGATADEASKLAYAANVTGVGVDALTRGINIATRALATHKTLGIEPNIDGLAKLSDMYLQIQDPIQRNAFLLHEFGRSGADLAPLMSLGSDGIKALGDQATITGNVLDQQMSAQLHTLSVQTNQLQIDSKGLGIELGTDLAPAALRVVDGGLNWVHTLDLIIKGQQAGSLTTEQAVTSFIHLTGILNPLKDTYADLAPTLQLVHDQQIAVSDASDRAAASQSYLADAYTYVQDPLVALNLATREAAAANDAATIKTYEAIQAIRDKTAALQDANDKTAVAAGIAGTLTKNEDTYLQVLAATDPKIADVKEQIAKLNAAQGQNIDVVVKGTYTAEQYSDAQTKLAIALQRQAEYHGKSQATVMSLQLAVDNARDSVDKMGAHLGSSTTMTADYSTKLGVLNGQLFDLQVAEGKAKDAMEKANKEFLYQSVASQLTADGQLTLAHSLGIMDDKTYDAAKAIEGYAKQLADHEITQQQFNQDIQNMSDQLNGVPPAADPIPAALQPMTDSFWAAQDAAQQAGLAIHYENDQIGGLHDKSITITTTLQTLYGASGPGYEGTGHATGADYIVPPGYPNDSYPVRVQSGERLIVIPKGKPGNDGATSSAAGGWGGGGGDTVIINDQLAAALYLENRRQTRLAQMERAM